MKKALLIVVTVLFASGCSFMWPKDSDTPLVQHESDLEILSTYGCQVQSLERRGKFIKIVCQDGLRH